MDFGICLSFLLLFNLPHNSGTNGMGTPSHELPEDPGQPLFLTPYIESGDAEKAKHLSRVGPLPNAPNVTSYSGYFTVNKNYGSNMFFWFFPSENGNKGAPLVLWLQGGQGTSSLFGLFVENGPFVVDPSGRRAGARPHSWARRFQVLYVDNPVGAGFSFTKSDRGYVTNQTAVADDLYEMLQQFFAVFHEYRSNDFYITGESYAGKYVPAVAYKIHTQGLLSNINLQGIALGNGFCDPETMLGYHDYFYQLGLIDRKQRSVMRNLSNSILEHIRRDEFLEATIGLDKLLLNFEALPFKTNYFGNTTGYISGYNHLVTSEPRDFGYFRTYIELPAFRKAVHVGQLPFNNGTRVQKRLLPDITKSVKPWVATLLENYRVLFYNGQLDLLVPYPLTVNFLHSVDWRYADDYRNAHRIIWKLSGTNEIAGYVHNVKDFYEVLVRNAGHIVPYDQPLFALDLITRFVNRVPFSQLI